MDINSRSALAAKHDRRRFLARMGLGAAAAPLVLGIGDSLIGRALGQTVRRKMALFFVHGESWNGGTHPITYLPPFAPELNLSGANAVKTPAAGQDMDKLMGPADFPPFFAALAPYASRMVLVDGLPLVGVAVDNPVHGLRNAVLCATGTAGNPGGITIDQHVAGVLSRDTPIKSLQFGIGARITGDEVTGTFASGPGAGVKHAQNPNTLLSRMVGTRTTGTGGGPAPALLPTKLLDLIREDLKRLQTGLAGPEKDPLGEYLASMESFQKKEQALAMQGSMGGCTIPGSPPAGQGPKPAVAAFDSMFRLSTLALKCGVTNVIGATMGNTDQHNDLALFVDYDSHSTYDAAMKTLTPVTMGWVATMLKDLGPLADSMTVTIVPSNGIGHTGPKEHHGCPTISAMVFDGPRALRTGARFLRIKRHAADFYGTMATALGAPVDRFNSQGAGPIKELLE